MNAYLLRHYQAAGMNGSKGFVTLVPIVLRPVAATADAADPEAEGQASADGATERR
jgi:hypothetical protein